MLSLEQINQRIRSNENSLDSFATQAIGAVELGDERDARHFARLAAEHARNVLRFEAAKRRLRIEGRLT